MNPSEIFNTPEASGFDRVTPDTDFTKHLLKSNDMLTTPDTEWEKEAEALGVLQKENIKEEEWEKDLRIRYRSQTLKMAEEVSKTGDYSKVEGMIVDWWLKELSSRDTYWKEQIQKDALKGERNRIIEQIRHEERAKLLRSEIEKLKNLRKELWLDYHNAQKWSEQKAVVETLDSIITRYKEELKVLEDLTKE